MTQNLHSDYGVNTSTPNETLPISVTESASTQSEPTPVTALAPSPTPAPTASKNITVDGVDQAVFLDENGNTVRLLLRSLSDGQLYADYRFEWSGDQICSISRLDTAGTIKVKHEFSYEKDHLKSDTITTMLDVWSCDYDWVNDKDDPAGNRIVSDGRGITIVTWPNTGIVRTIDVLNDAHQGEIITFRAKDAAGQAQYTNQFTFFITDDGWNGSQLLTIDFTEDGQLLNEAPFMAGSPQDAVFYDREWNEMR